MELNSLVRQVTQYTVSNPYERDCWEKAPAITGVLAWEDATAIEAVTRWLDRAVATQRSDGNLSYGDASSTVTAQGHLSSAGHVRSLTPTASLSASLGYPLLLRYRQTKNPAYLEAARRQYEGLLASPRTSDGGIWARKEGPELWIDFVYLMGPFMALYGLVTGDQSAIDEAFAQYDVHVRHLVDPVKKLARHAWCERPDHYPQSTFWLRGNGWMVCAAVDLLTLVPSHPGAAAMRESCAETLKAMAECQDACGYFLHVLDDPTSNFEASGTLMFAYAVARAIELGIAPESMRAAALKAFRVVAGAVEPSGKVPGVAVPPGGPGVPFNWTLFGQGFFLLAAHELRRYVGEL